MKSICIVLMLSGVCLIAINGTAAEWIHYGSKQNGDDFFYDRDSVSFSLKDIVRVSIKHVYSEQGKKDEIYDRVIINRKLTQSFIYLSHSLCQLELNCNKKEPTMLVLGCTYYTKAGEILDSSNISEEIKEKWRLPIGPTEPVLTVCKLLPKAIEQKK